MSVTNILIIAVMAVLALFIYWLMKRNFEQSITIQSLEQEIAKLSNQQLEREMTFQRQLEVEIKQAKKRSNDAQRNVLKGQIGEQFTPFITDFPYNPADCCFFGEPIDYLIFHNLHDCSEGSVAIEEVKIIFAEVKTGKAKLSPRQKILRQVIANGQVEFKELRIQVDEETQNPLVVTVN